LTGHLSSRRLHLSISIYKHHKIAISCTGVGTGARRMLDISIVGLEAVISGFDGM
jgi:hypothetical protein